jgi:hypothetical protein
MVLFDGYLEGGICVEIVCERDCLWGCGVLECWNVGVDVMIKTTGVRE